MRDAFVQQSISAESAFTAEGNEHWHADLKLLAKQRLQALQIAAIYGDNFCTYTQADLFYSYRRDGQTGRIASLIYIKQ